jgi:hypothetical protein
MIKQLVMLEMIDTKDMQSLVSSIKKDGNITIHTYEEITELYKVYIERLLSANSHDDGGNISYYQLIITNLGELLKEEESLGLL